MNNQNFRVTPDLYASTGNRFANYIIDKIIFYVLVIGLGFLIAVIVYSFFTETSAFDQLLIDIDNMSSLMDRLITSIVFMIFYMISEILLKGKTIGKYITKTLVVMEDGSKPKPSDIALRSLCRLIPFDAFSFLGTQGKGWHDTVSKTYVVDEVKFKAKKSAQVELDQIGIEQELE